MASNKIVKGLKRTALTLALSMCFAGAAFAANTGGLRIVITGTGGQPVAGATVKVSSPSSLITKTGTTLADGSVNLNGLDPATNYTVEVVASGYSPFTTSNVAVISDKSLSLGYRLGSVDASGATNLDTVVVTGSSLAAVDTTSATVSTVLTLDQVESLPTARSYQSYLQLVPGVKPAAGGNPSSKSGVNFTDAGGAVGTSTDNLYYIDGVNVTDPLTGTFGSNLNSEIIQEMQVLTGGLPAEFGGGSGLVSKVITKSGSNEFHGSINYYLQNSSLVSSDKHVPGNNFSTYDTAFTLGGPIVKDRLWFFMSYQLKNRSQDVTDANTHALMRTVTTRSNLWFGKLTWQITDDDRLTATFFNDPYKASGSLSSSTLNNRSNVTEQGGNNYKLEYTHDWENLRIGAYAFRHEGDLSVLPGDPAPFNNVAYHADAGTVTNADLNLGGSGSATETHRDRKEWGINAEYFLYTSGWGDHDFKLGYLRTDGTYTERVSYPSGARYTSMGITDSGTTFAQYFAGSYGWAGPRSVSTSDVTRIVNAYNAANAIDITSAQLLAKQLTDTAGNPNGMVNVYRILQSANPGLAYTVTSREHAFYLQDLWTFGQWSANIGVRLEKEELINSAGGTIHEFDWNVAPRLSLTYDLNGDGRSKIWAFYGRYYDPIRADMADFAGAITGPTYDEQVNIDGTWYTFRQRGPGDAAIAPATKTPYTDEFMVGYATTFGENVGLSVTLTRRKTRDIMEDYDLGVYSDPSTPCGSIELVCSSSGLYLPYSYFGYTSPPPVNYVIGTLAGGKRDYTGFEITLQRFKADNWQAAASYTHNAAMGNSNSDGNADLQGDLIALDPRAPNQYGPQPGNVKHQFKAWGSYEFDFGLELSAVFNWNSGVLLSRAEDIYGRHMAELGPAYLYDGVISNWALPGNLGGLQGPSYYTLDFRAKYTHALPVGEIELFMDIFNILNRQSPTSVQDLTAGDGVYNFGEPVSWVQPRRAYLGVRYKF